MQRFPRFLAVIAVAVATLASVARAQLVTFETISQFSGSNATFNGGVALTQTFTNVTQIQSMTYRFLAAGGSSGATTLNYYFTEWNSTTNRAIGTAIQSGSISLLASSDTSTIQAGGSNWQTYQDSFSNNYVGLDWQFTLGATVNHNATYAMILVGTTNGSNLALQNVDNGSTFAFGQNFRTAGISTNLVNGYTSMMNTSPSNVYSSDWGFSQIVVAPYIAPVPEASTIAILFAAVFIAFLVGMRLRQRRLALATATVAVAR